MLDHVVAGRLNKQIAGDLGTVEKTIKVHRGRMMEKLGVHTVADLVRMAEKRLFRFPQGSVAARAVGPTANSTPGNRCPYHSAWIKDSERDRDRR